MNNERRITCECGCERETRKDATGQPRRFVRGHNRRGQGSGWIQGGYRYISIDGHRIAFHRWVMEQKIGRRLTSDEIVHHVDGNPLNNDPRNLVILSRAEHTHLHRAGTKGRHATKEERERVIYLKKRGMTDQQVVNVTGRPLTTIRRWIAAAA